METDFERLGESFVRDLLIGTWLACLNGIYLRQDGVDYRYCPGDLQSIGICQCGDFDLH